MTREEAIKTLRELWRETNDSRYEEVFRMAIEALHREEAEEKGYCHRIIPSNVEVVVRCKDCKHWLQHEQFGFDEDNDEYHDYCGLLIPEDEYYAYTRKSDDYCSYGERKGGDSE